MSFVDLRLQTQVWDQGGGSLALIGRGASTPALPPLFQGQWVVLGHGSCNFDL